MSSADWVDGVFDEMVSRMRDSLADERDPSDMHDLGFVDTDYDLRAVTPRSEGWYVFDNGFWTGAYQSETDAVAALHSPSGKERFSPDALVVNVTVPKIY